MYDMASLCAYRQSLSQYSAKPIHVSFRSSSIEHRKFCASRLDTRWWKSALVGRTMTKSSLRSPSAVENRPVVRTARQSEQKVEPLTEHLGQRGD